MRPSIHCFRGSATVGVQCPLASSLGEFTGYWDWLRYPGLPSVLVSIAFPFAFHISVFFLLPLLHLPLDFIRASSLGLRLMYLHPSVDPSLTHFFGEFPGLGLDLVPDVVVQEVEQECD